MDMRTEPARIVGLITAAVAAVLVLLVEFGIDITEGQQTAIQGFVAVIAPLIAGVIIREQVYAPATVEKIEEQAKADAYHPLRPDTWPSTPAGASVVPQGTDSKSVIGNVRNP